MSLIYSPSIKTKKPTSSTQKIDIIPIIVQLVELFLIFILCTKFDGTTAIFIAGLCAFFTIFFVYGLKFIKGTKRIFASPRRIAKIFLFTIILFAFALLFKFLVPAGDNTEDLSSYPLPFQIMLFIEAVIFAPVVEEMTDRYSLSTIIKNKYLFVFVSGLLFALFHIRLDLYFFYYLILGCSLAIIYLTNRKNAVVTILIHSLLNLATFFIP